MRDDLRFTSSLPHEYCRLRRSPSQCLRCQHVSSWRILVEPILTFLLDSRPLRLSIRLAMSVILLTNAPALRAQDAASPKFAAFAGAGIDATQQNSRGEIQTGASFDEAPPGSWGGFLFEGGYLGPWANVHEGSAFASADYIASWSLGQKGRGRTASGQPYWSADGNFFPLPVPATRGFSVPATLLILAVDSTTGSVTITPFG
jgi:hypothetical protein